MRDPDTGAAAIQIRAAWVPRRRARGDPGAPPRARRLSPGRRYQRFFLTHFPHFFTFLLVRWTRSGLGFRSRALRRNLTGEMRNSGNIFRYFKSKSSQTNVSQEV